MLHFSPSEKNNSGVLCCFVGWKVSANFQEKSLPWLHYGSPSEKSNNLFVCLFLCFLLYHTTLKLEVVGIWLQLTMIQQENHQDENRHCTPLCCALPEEFTQTKLSTTNHHIYTTKLSTTNQKYLHNKTVNSKPKYLHNKTANNKKA